MRTLVDLPISLSRESAAPLTAQLAGWLRGAMLAGTLAPGERLPSSRGLAAQLEVSRTVVTEAYQQLYAEGWLEGRHGSGTFVASLEAPRRAVPETRRARDAGRRAVAGRAEIDLTPGHPWVRDYDRAAWKRAWRKAADLPPGRLPRPVRPAAPARTARRPPAQGPGRAGGPGERPGHQRHRQRARPVRAGAARRRRPGGRGGSRLSRGAHRVRRQGRGGGAVPGGRGRGDRRRRCPTTCACSTPRRRTSTRSAGGCRSRAGNGCSPGPGAPARSSWRTTTTPSSATTSPRCPPSTASTRPAWCCWARCRSRWRPMSAWAGWWARPELLGQDRRHQRVASATAPAARCSRPWRPSWSAATSTGTCAGCALSTRAAAPWSSRCSAGSAACAGTRRGCTSWRSCRRGTGPEIVERAAERGVLLDTVERHHFGPERLHGLVIGYGSASLTDVGRGCRILAELISDAT